MDEIEANSKHLLYPPGGLLIWSLVLMELLTFGVALICFINSSHAEPDVFSKSCAKLNATFGIVNTVLLLGSGYFMALGVGYFKAGNNEKSHRFLLLTMLGGIFFVVMKGFEYSDKIDHGFVLGFNTFFTYYWLLTIFHVLHVIVGLVILFSLWRGLKNPQKPVLLENYEAGAIFWHMCDLIWLVLFPVIYLLV